MQAARDPRDTAPQLAAVDPLERGLEVIQACRPQDQLRSEADERRPILDDRSSLVVHAGVAHGELFKGAMIIACIA